jgi:sensor histidine kinase YesM
METILEVNKVKPGYWSLFMAWIQQRVKPFVIRWWIWFALVMSPAYMIYHFNQSSLEERIAETVHRNTKLQKHREKHGESIGALMGLFLGFVVGTITKGWQVFSMIAILILALLQLQYKHIFQPLFERDTEGRRIYIGLICFGWLFIAFVFSFFVGRIGLEGAYHWTIANVFILLNVGYSLFMSWRNARRRQLILMQQRTQAELDALKAQVNPHFLFNSLNNIYGTAILEDSPRTAESIQQLSGIVRYVMEESRLQTTDIRRELRFIDDFVELQRIRLPNQDNIDIQVTIDWDEKPARIVPLLLNPIIENAFKYGISMQYPCFVHVQLRVQEGTLHLTTENSVLARTDLERGTGLGLANVRQRLVLAYPERHTLTVSEGGNTFLIDLEIRL